jgi:exonuclease SbcD
MRLLHTSDWHLGRTFGPVSLAADQAAFIDWLVDLCAAERIDLVVIAGDVYDRAIAPTESVVMFREALVRLQGAGRAVAVVTGNHDGADRVAAYDELMDVSRVLIRGGYSRLGEVVTVAFADGPLDLVLLPFLDPQAAPDQPVEPPTDLFAFAEAEAAGDAFDRRMRRTHQSVLRAAVHAAQASLVSPRSLAVAHAFVTGGEPSESERPLTVGTAGRVEASLFTPFSYTALGHLHMPQFVGGRSDIRYSGAPLPYSFSETHAKSVTIIDMAPDGASVITEVDVPVGRPVLTVTGTIDDLLRREPTARQRSSFVRAVVTDPGVVLDARQRLAAVFPHVVEIVLEPPPLAGDEHRSSVDGAALTPTQIADLFWTQSIGEEPTDEQRAMLHAAIDDADARIA